MQVQSMHFKVRAGQKLADMRLQKNLKKLSEKFVTARAAAITELDDFEATRDAAVERRNRALAHLDVWLEIFERNASARGAKVLYAETHEEAVRLIVDIAKHHGVRKVTKSKSMVSEEVGLNHAFEAAGIQPVETDLGEYILQINDNEAPSHIIAPVIHKDKEEISDLFAKTHATPRKTEITQLTREAREVLRSHFLSADMGVTGANFLIAETGSATVVTNEGNEGMCTILPPKVHVVLTGIEKVLPTLEDVATLMRLLPRSATGQPISNYFSVLTGPRRPGEEDGPEHMYYVLVDAGRTGLLGGEFQEMLRCIRCGACMNHCPVYQKIGGHAYGWVYPGPMGSVLTPSYVGIEKVLGTLEDLATVARLLPRSATGQSISNYFSILTGPRAPGEQDGPEHMYFVLVDGGRTGLLGGEFQEMLRCIRCGACMNHCPVYQKIGGHAYGWVYPGPMGSVLTPSYVGIENALDLPQAATLCGQCSVVCPVKIPLPDLLRKLREKQWDRGLRPWYEKVGVALWAYAALRPSLYAFGSKVAVRVLRWMGGDAKRIRTLPVGAGWTVSRDFPAPSGRTFREMYRERRASGQAGSTRT